MIRRLVILLAAATLATPGAALAAPRVTGTFALPSGLVPGGFVQHGFAADTAGNAWLTTDTANGARVKPALVRVSPSGRTTTVKISVAGGIDFSGIGLGPANRIWFSGTENSGNRQGVNGYVSGTTASFTVAPDGTSWSQLAVLGGTAYCTDGFDDLLISTNGRTFTQIGIANVSPFDIADFAGGLAVAGDDAIGILSPGSLAASPATATLLTTTGSLSPSSRYETVAGGRLWFLQENSSGAVGALGSAGPDGVATIGAVDPAARGITTGPDGMPWVLTNSAAERIGPSGAVSAKVKLPAGQTGILIGGASSKYVWVATVKRSNGRGELVRISVA